MSTTSEEKPPNQITLNAAQQQIEASLAKFDAAHPAIRNFRDFLSRHIIQPDEHLMRIPILRQPRAQVQTCDGINPRSRPIQRRGACRHRHRQSQHVITQADVLGYVWMPSSWFLACTEVKRDRNERLMVFSRVPLGMRDGGLSKSV